MSSYRLHPSILREYDIRGIVGETLTADCAFHIGRAFGTYVCRRGGKTIVVSRDGRESSPILERSLIQGLIQTGLHITHIEMGPTPLVLFAQQHFNCDASIMVTASHNPPSYNGFKMALGDYYLYGQDIKALGETVGRADYEKDEGEIMEATVEEAYIAYLLADFHSHYSQGRPLKIAWDASNGSAGHILEHLVASLPGEHILLNSTIDGSFPAHPPDPSHAENLEQLQQCVRDRQCDLGIAFDGDGDRLGVVDEKGEILWGDHLILLFAKEVLSKNPGSTIIGDIKVSQVTFEAIQSSGGKPLMWRTGRSLIKSKMLETQSPFAGEMSGHIFFADRYYGYDDALYAALRLVGSRMLDGEPLSNFRKQIPSVFNTPELRFSCAEEQKSLIVHRIAEQLRKRGIPFTDLDGIRTLYNDGWWLLRASNTTNDLVARIEAKTLESLNELREELFGYLEENGICTEG